LKYTHTGLFFREVAYINDDVPGSVEEMNFGSSASWSMKTSAGRLTVLFEIIHDFPQFLKAYYLAD
jgi:hypothetical protein